MDRSASETRFRKWDPTFPNHRLIFLIFSCQLIPGPPFLYRLILFAIHQIIPSPHTTALKTNPIFHFSFFFFLFFKSLSRLCGFWIIQLPANNYWTPPLYRQSLVAHRFVLSNSTRWLYIRERYPSPKTLISLSLSLYGHGRP